MYYVKGNSEAEDYKTVFFTEDKLYEVKEMKIGVLSNSRNPMEFYVSDDDGILRWSSSDWFDLELIFKEKTVENI